MSKELEKVAAVLAGVVERQAAVLRLNEAMIPELRVDVCAAERETDRLRHHNKTARSDARTIYTWLLKLAVMTEALGDGDSIRKLAVRAVREAEQLDVTKQDVPF